MLGWCCKEGLLKHLADLAVVARDHAETLNRQKVQRLIREKFESEKDSEESAGLYRRHGLHRPRDLNLRFASPARLKDVSRGWAAALDTQIWLVRSEHGHPRSPADFENVIASIDEFWSPLIAEL